MQYMYEYVEDKKIISIGKILEKTLEATHGHMLGSNNVSDILSEQPYYKPKIADVDVAINRFYSHVKFSDGQYLSYRWRKKEEAQNKRSENWELTSFIVQNRNNIFTPPGTRFNFNKLKEYLSGLLVAIYAKAGNCHVMSLFAMHYLLQLQDPLIERVELVDSNQVDHCFLLINRVEGSSLSNPNTWKCLILDPWYGSVREARIAYSEDLHIVMDLLDRLSNPNPVTNPTLGVRLTGPPFTNQNYPLAEINSIISGSDVLPVDADLTQYMKDRAAYYVKFSKVLEEIGRKSEPRHKSCLKR